MNDNRQIHFHHHEGYTPEQGKNPPPRGPGLFGLLGLLIWAGVFLWVFK